MEDKDLEVLLLHADQLNAAMVRDVPLADMTEEDKAELLSLMSLAGKVKGALAPVSPSPAFRQKLRLELLQKAGRGTSREVILASPAPYKEVVVGAVIGSAVALLGGVAYLVRSYVQNRLHHPDRMRS